MTPAHFAPHPALLEFIDSDQTVIVNLKPAGMYRLLGIPMAELVECDYDACQMMSREIDELLDRLHEGRN